MVEVIGLSRLVARLIFICHKPIDWSPSTTCYCEKQLNIHYKNARTPTPARLGIWHKLVSSDFLLSDGFSSFNFLITPKTGLTVVCWPGWVCYACNTFRSVPSVQMQCDNTYSFCVDFWLCFWSHGRTPENERRKQKQAIWTRIIEMKRFCLDGDVLMLKMYLLYNIIVIQYSMYSSTQYHHPAAAASEELECIALWLHMNSLNVSHLLFFIF